MPSPRIHRRKSALIQPPPHRPSTPDASTRTSRKLSDTHIRVVLYKPQSACIAAPQGLPAARSGVTVRQHAATKGAYADHIARIYDRLAVEQALFRSADPGMWLQRSIDRAEDGEAVVQLIRSYNATRHDVAHVETQFVLRPSSHQTANRWLLRLNQSDMDESVRFMGDAMRAREQFERDGLPYPRPATGQVVMAGMRLAHESWRNATWVDMSYKHLGDDHLYALLPRVQGFSGMQFFDLSHNTLTDTHLGFLAAMLHAHPQILGLDLSGNPITEQGIADFNKVSLRDGPDTGLHLREDLQAFKPIADFTSCMDMRAEQSAVFEVIFGTALRVACGRTSKGAHAVAALAAEPGALRRMYNLDLSGKSWQHADIQALAELLQRDGMRLTHLDFADGKFPQGGVAALARALSPAHRLKTLRLTGVPIDPAGDAHLLELVQNTTSLWHIAGSNTPQTEAELLRRASGGLGLKPKSPRPDSLTPPTGGAPAGSASQQLHGQVAAALRD